MYYEDLIPSLEAIIPDVTDDILLYGLRSAGLKFFKESKVWCESLGEFKLNSGRNEIEMDAPEEAAIHSVPLVIVNGCALEPVGNGRIEEEQATNGTPRFYYKEGNILKIGPTPTAQTVFKIYAVVAPTLTSDQVVADSYMDRYSDAIVWAAAHIIMAMPRKPWSDKQSSGIYLGMYEDTKIEARREALNYLEGASSVMDYRNATASTDY